MQSFEYCIFDQAKDPWGQTTQKLNQKVTKQTTTWTEQQQNNNKNNKIKMTATTTNKTNKKIYGYNITTTT